MTKQERIEELEKILEKCLWELQFHNEEYGHVTPKELIEEIKQVLEK